MRKNVCLALICICTATLAAGQETKQPTPAEGYTVHVSAPHVINGKVMGPFHHYCKVHSPDPVIVCLIYDSAEPNARLSQIEYIIAKKITRANVSLKEWNRHWHDHRLEIATGRVQVHDLPKNKAKEVADLVATTDGLIFSLWPAGATVPPGTAVNAQSVGHKPITAAEFKSGAQDVAAVSK